MKNRITIHILTKDRPTELALVLNDLRNQTYQNFDILIVDDASQIPIQDNYYIAYLINRLKLENHMIKVVRNDFSQGCCYGRNLCIKKDDFKSDLILRLDDDGLIGSTYIADLMKVIDAGYDMATGVIPHINQPEIIRETKYLGKIINEHKFDENGNLIKQDDECGFCYNEEQIIPTHQFRTNCLYYSKINDDIKYPSTLSTVAFREEGYYSFSAIIAGYKIGVNTKAVCYHLQCPVGGNRRKDYSECVQQDDAQFKKWCKEQFKLHGDFLKKYSEQFK